MRKFLIATVFLTALGVSQAKADDPLTLKVIELQKAIEELTDLNLQMAKSLRKTSQRIEQLEEEIAELKKQIRALKNRKPAYSYRRSYKRAERLESRGYTPPNKVVKVSLDKPVSAPKPAQVVIKLPDSGSEKKVQIVVATYLHYDKNRLWKIWQNLSPLIKRYPVKAYISPRKKYLVVFVEASPKERFNIRRLGFRDAFVAKTELFGKKISTPEDLKELVLSAEQVKKEAVAG